mmetsp:Transcript_9899/g.34785  ORF Transcript_9899/g.34785 Transcript_9899/m.34785 type:complete len:298 (-) Transcript_9899:26-919(-)
MFWQGHLRQSRRHLQLPVAIHRGRVRKDGLRALWQGRVQRARDVLEHAATRAERENESSLDAVHLRRRLSQRRKHVGRRPRLRLRLRRRVERLRLFAADVPFRGRPGHDGTIQRGATALLRRLLGHVHALFPRRGDDRAEPCRDGGASRGSAQQAGDCEGCEGRLLFWDNILRFGQPQKRRHRPLRRPPRRPPCVDRRLVGGGRRHSVRRRGFGGHCRQNARFRAGQYRGGGVLRARPLRLQAWAVRVLWGLRHVKRKGQAGHARRLRPPPDAPKVRPRRLRQGARRIGGLRAGRLM